MKKVTRPIVAFWLAAAILTLSLPARADLISLWRMDETTGTAVPNSVSGGTTAAMFGGATWVVDSERGKVLSFDGVDGYAAAGTTPALSAAGSDFTWSFWANSAQGANSNVIFGNRFDGAGNSWVKFTTSKFEYVPNGSQQGIDYADIGAGGWAFHTVVKSGNTLTYYRNTAAGGTSTVSTDLVSLPLRFGGDPTAERWAGKMDNAALFNSALTPAQVSYAMTGMYGRFANIHATSFSDGFAGSALDSTKWDVATKGLEANFGSGYNDPVVSGGQVTLGGTTGFSYWRGSSIATQATFDVPAGGELRFDVDRVSLSGTGTGSRSSLWMYADDSNYVHFAQNTETGGDFRYNANNNTPTGGGVGLSRASGFTANYGDVHMTMINDGSFVKMYVDGRYLGSQAATFSSNISLMLTGQARAAGDTVQAVFDNAAASTRTYRNLYDNFNASSIDPAKWTVIQKGLEHEGSFPGTLAASIQNGVLTFNGTTGSQYWYGVTLKSVPRFTTENGATFTVQREALDKSGSAGRSSVWLWADDTHFLHFAENFGENGWQYNYADGTVISGTSTGGGVNLSAFDAFDGDGLSHEMTIALRKLGTTVYMDMYLDGVLGASQPFANWGDSTFNYMLTGQPRASGDSVFAAFDNVDITIPEPATMTLLGLAVASVSGYLRRRRSGCRG